MSELSKELTDRINEAGKDADWAEKFRVAATWEEYEKLLGEKGIEAPAELKAAFAKSRADKCGELADDELESVTGGWLGTLLCQKKYIYMHCVATLCGHHVLSYRSDRPGEVKDYCDLGYWGEPWYGA